MPEWEIHPFRDIDRQNEPAIMLEQIEQELEAMAEKKLFLLDLHAHYKARLIEEFIEGVGGYPV